ncbi:MAG: hypothetical protein J1E57_05215 [Prevotella sp.]|nr:hypothetical protein [Prevotella sp.]
MVFDICFFKYSNKVLSQYPTLDYAKGVINESLGQTLLLHGKRQLCFIKRSSSGAIRMFQIYNYIYNGENSFGICIVYYDEYSQDVEFLFNFFSSIVANIVEEGKVLYFDTNGRIVSAKEGIEHYYSILAKYKNRITSALQNLKSGIKPIPLNVYNNYIDQHIVCQRSDKSWSMDEVMQHNNIVIITEEIEDENINSMRGLIKRSYEEVDKLNIRIRALTSHIEHIKHEKGKGASYGHIQNVCSKTNITAKQEKEKNNVDKFDIIMWLITGGFILSIFFNLITPWFIDSIWSKISVVLTGIGACSFFYALNDNSKKEYENILMGGGVIVILLSTLFTIYCCFGGFSKNDNNESYIQSIQEPESFMLLGEGVNRPENFDADTIVTPENIKDLYCNYNVCELFNGDYYLIRSKKSYTDSRYFSRLILMKNGKQTAAQTFYDSEIDSANIIRLGNRIVVGLNSLRVNNYDSTFQYTTHSCRVIILSDNLTPISGKRFSSNIYNRDEEHTYVNSLKALDDKFFSCHIKSDAGVCLFTTTINDFSLFHYKYNNNIEMNNLSFANSDWGNDISDGLLVKMKARQLYDKANDSVRVRRKEIR